MSNEPKPQDTQDEPKQDVKPTDELADEQLDDVTGGSYSWSIAPTSPTQQIGPTPLMNTTKGN
jgi:hypothetical protein